MFRNFDKGKFYWRGSSQVQSRGQGRGLDYKKNNQVSAMTSYAAAATEIDRMSSYGFLTSYGVLPSYRILSLFRLHQITTLIPVGLSCLMFVDLTMHAT